MNWPHTTQELGEFVLILLFCVLPAIWIVMNINNIIYGVFH